MKEVKKKLNIGQVAKIAGVGVETIRFYERQGVLPQSERKPSGYRQFTEEDIERLRRIKALQDVGMSLEEVRRGLKNYGYVLDFVSKKIATLTELRKKIQKQFKGGRNGNS